MAYIVRFWGTMRLVKSRGYPKVMIFLLCSMTFMSVYYLDFGWWCPVLIEGLILVW